MTPWRERDTIRLLHIVLSVPIVGYLYGPVAHIPHAAWFTRWIAMPIVVLSGFWLWLKPRIVKRMHARRSPAPHDTARPHGAVALRPPGTLKA
ncbi:MAG TPA: hypothetical protein VME86_11450 [Acidobacteriaceae bacterium]|nr:hypothetical protein [Acidobacteriaceae bacterium]HUB00579.1 hypothetical protein [Terracidiphilus sp.]